MVDKKVPTELKEDHDGNIFCSRGINSKLMDPLGSLGKSGVVAGNISLRGILLFPYYLFPRAR